jgi:ATP-dependent Clp protease ATP-binding subunit ClpA
MGRIIQKRVKEPLAEKILFGELKEGGHVVVDAAEDEIRLTVKPLVPAEPVPG